MTAGKRLYLISVFLLSGSSGSESLFMVTGHKKKSIIGSCPIQNTSRKTVTIGCILVAAPRETASFRLSSPFHMVDKNIFILCCKIKLGKRPVWQVT